MHIPDGYLGPPTYVSLWAAMLGLWSYAARKVQRELKASEAPYLAMASAFSFVAMIFAIPLPGGTTAHITGATLVAILLGPWSAIIAVSVALTIQALMFGDGGVTALAANCFNIAFADSFAGYGVYRLIMLAGRRLSSIKAASDSASGQPGYLMNTVGTAIASYVGINIAALLTALELGIQPLLYGEGQAGAGYFPYGLNVTIPAIVIPHMTFVGGLEAGVTAMVIGYVRKGGAKIMQRGKVAVFLITGLLMLQASIASAHDYWIEQKGDSLMLVFGHGSQRLEFEAEKAKSVKAVDAQGKDLAVQPEKKGRGLLLRITGQPAMITAIVDNGYWSKTIYGWKEEPKRKASRVVEAIRQLYYTRHLMSWTEAAQSPATGHTIAITPLQNPFLLKPGDALQVKVLFNGVPLAGAEVNGGEHNELGKTDKDGVIKIPLLAGANMLSIEHKEKIKNDPDADALDETATLTFEVKK
jgi:cobalt/nickel transport system permease protein